MPVTITGGKYSAASVSSVGTTTVTVGTTPFVSSDFAVSRRADLYNSAGTIYKGSAFVRSWVSTSQLQLETEFFNFRTGAIVSQVVGDTVLISKNWLDSVTTGITVSNTVVTVSDTITFGTAGSFNSVAFHDEGVTVQTTVITNGAVMFTVAGGMLTFGHLLDYATQTYYNSCRFLFTGAVSGQINTFLASDATASRMFLWGGQLINLTTAVGTHFGSGFALGVSVGTDWNYLYVHEAEFYGIGPLSLNTAGNWVNGANHVLNRIKCLSDKSVILLRWGNGVVNGGTYKILNNSATPISVFGSDFVATFTISAISGERLIVADVGPNALWRSSAAVAQTLNFTNVISPNWIAGFTTFNPEANFNPSATINIYYQDPYSNLQDSTLVAIIHDGTWVADSVVVSSGAASRVSPTLFRGSGAGGTLNATRSPWTARIRKYGFIEIEQAISESSYSLGTAGTAFNVAFGGNQNQIAKSSLPAQAVADAVTGVSVVNHGASPVAWNSKTWGITITGDLTVNSSLTAAQLFAFVKSQITKSTNWGGQAGYLWHVLVDEIATGGYSTARGISGGAGAILKGVRVIDQSGNPFPGFVSMQANDGTFYVPPISYTLTVTNIVSGSRVLLRRTDTLAVLANVLASGGTYTYNYVYSADIPVEIVVRKSTSAPFYQEWRTTTTLTSGNNSQTSNQILDT